MVDDEPTNLKILRLRLHENYELAEASSGEEALVVAEQFLPAIILLDIMMPGMSGFELIARLKAEGCMPPTIVLTGKQREEDILRGLEFGVLDYIVKPFSPSVLLAKVRNAIARKVA